MFRWLIALVLGVGIAGGVAYYNGWIPEHFGEIGGTVRANTADPAAPKMDLGELLYAAVALDPLPRGKAKEFEQLIIEPCHVVVGKKQDVSSQREGHILFIGQDVTDQPLSPTDNLPPPREVKVFDGEKFRILKFRPLEEGDVVEPGQIVALINPQIASHEVESKGAKLKAAEADYQAAVQLLDETKKRRANFIRLRDTSKGAISELDISEASMGVAKYNGEEITKKWGIEVAKYELAQTKLVLKQHFLENKLTGKGRVKKIYKRDGEGIKPQETIMELQDISQLRIEGMVDSQYYNKLHAHPNAICYLEPSVEMGAVPLMKSHLAEVNSVAVCADGRHFVSGSEDRMVYIWEVGQDGPVATLRHKSPVRTVVCHPKDPRVVIVGCADGSLTHWDLTNNPPQQKKFKEKTGHRGPITALGLSPDGAYLASGSEDNSIIIWDVAGCEELYPFDVEHGVDDPHQGTITSLFFTPQCKLVSAARDNSLRVWTLYQKGAALEGEPILNRGGTVGQLGVSANGRFMLLDKGRTLQLRNTEDGSLVCVMDNLSGPNPFDTLALFSPDGSLMLTGGAGEGHLHLWKTPTAQERAYQVRELVSKDRTAITSAAFAPGNHRFAVTGSKEGYVHLWLLPDKTVMDNHIIARDANNRPLHVDLLEPEQAAGKARLAVNVLNPQDRLIPGQRVSLVVVLPLTAQ